ncbi:MAG: transporter permease [Ilumatobacteraceae bacterium]|nr:transporter permease [Ilumatobacteraceae bacterium]
MNAVSSAPIELEAELEAARRVTPPTAATATSTARRRGPWLTPQLTLPVLAICLVPAVWAFIAETGMFGNAVVGPVETAKEIHSHWDVLWLNAKPTLEATLIGVAVLLVIIAGGAVVVALVPRVTAGLAALSIVLGTLPLIVLTPMLSLVTERGRNLVAEVCVLAGLVPVAATLSGMARIGERGREDLGAVYGTSRLRWWRFVGFWQTVPILDIGIRAMIPSCFVGSIVAEWSGASTSRGLGQVMTNAMFSYQPPLLWATLTIAAIGSLGLLALATLIMYPLTRRVR